MDVAGCPHKPGDVLYINDERWLVEFVIFKGNYTTVNCIPLQDYLARKTRLVINNESITIAEYLASLCNEYESNCAG